MKHTEHVVSLVVMWVTQTITNFVRKFEPPKKKNKSRVNPAFKPDPKTLFFTLATPLYLSHYIHVILFNSITLLARSDQFWDADATLLRFGNSLGSSELFPMQNREHAYNHDFVHSSLLTTV